MIGRLRFLKRIGASIALTLPAPPRAQPISTCRGISWSTASVFAETVAAAEAAGIEVVELPLWYDVDDGETLGLLSAELLDDVSPAFAKLSGYKAEHTRAYLRLLRQQEKC